jgi:hypothetical protein
MRIRIGRLRHSVGKKADAPKGYDRREAGPYQQQSLLRIVSAFRAPP